MILDEAIILCVQHKHEDVPIRADMLRRLKNYLINEDSEEAEFFHGLLVGLQREAPNATVFTLPNPFVQHLIEYLQGLKE